MDREAELLRHHRLGQPGRELRAVPREGPPRRDRRPPRVARVGGAGRHQAPGGRGRSPTRVQFLGGRGDGGAGGGENQFVPAGRGRRPDADFAARPTTTSRSKEEPVAAPKSERRTQPEAPAPLTGAAAASRASSARRRSTRSTTRTSASCAATSPRRGRSARGGSAARAAATSARSRSRSSAPARWRCSRTWPSGSRGRRPPRPRRPWRPRDGSVEVVLRQDVDTLGLRGEVVNVARGYARNYLLPRGLAEVATPGLVRELERRDAAAGPPRGEDGRRGDRRSPTGSRRPSSGSTSTPARPARCSARSPRRTSPTGSGTSEKIRDRPPQARDGHDQAHRPLHGAGRGLRRRDR